MKKINLKRETSEAEKENNRKSIKNALILSIGGVLIIAVIAVFYAAAGHPGGINGFFEDIRENISNWWDDFTFKNDGFFRFIRNLFGQA